MHENQIGPPHAFYGSLIFTISVLHWNTVFYVRRSDNDRVSDMWKRTSISSYENFAGDTPYASYLFRRLQQTERISGSNMKVNGFYTGLFFFKSSTFSNKEIFAIASFSPIRGRGRTGNLHTS